MIEKIPITNSDRKILKKQSRETLARWYCELNRWSWPSKIPNPDTEKRVGRRMSIMKYITYEVGEKIIHFFVAFCVCSNYIININNKSSLK